MRKSPILLESTKQKHAESINEVKVNEQEQEHDDDDEKEEDEEEDYDGKLLDETNSRSVYNECTIPINEPNTLTSSILSKATEISACLAVPLTTTTGAIQQASTTSNVDVNNNYNDNDNNNDCCSIPLTNGFNCVALTNLDGIGGGAGAGQFTMVDLNKSNLESDQGYYDDDHDSDDRVLASPNQVKFTNSKTDMFQSINNLRLNVNNHLIGSSKNVMGRMRKLSLNELNRHNGGKSGRKYKIAFYVALCSLSILFLYLIYQNLFNDR